MTTPRKLSAERRLEDLHQVDSWLGRKTEGPVNPCAPACAFMMDYKTLDAIRNMRDHIAALDEEIANNEKWEIHWIDENKKRNSRYYGLGLDKLFDHIKALNEEKLNEEINALKLEVEKLTSIINAMAEDKTAYRKIIILDTLFSKV